MDIKSLREEVNPVYMTARGCLQTMAANGDPKAIQLLEKLHFKPLGEGAREALPPEVLSAAMKYISAVSSSNEARFRSTNMFLNKLGVKQVLDLPCGYTTRGLTMTEEGIRYYGADLPAVIDDIGPAALSLAGEAQKELLRYQAADATNYDSVRGVLDGASGELAITTEGLLMYLSDSEINEWLDTIHRLLDEFGGFWMTMDPEISMIGHSIANKALEGESYSADALYRMLAGRSSNNELNNNFIYKKSQEEAIELIAAKGFKIERVPLGDNVPELFALKNLPDKSREEILDMYRNVSLWIARPAKEPKKLSVLQLSQKSFKADAVMNDEELQIYLEGRLDTLTSPDLLKAFREIESTEKITSITIDAENLSYVSSAGLRVFMIMYKALPGKRKQLYIKNTSDEVSSILDISGFSELFL